MRREQWQVIRRCAAGEQVDPTPVALIVDSPWIPGFLGLSTLDYLTVPEVWLEANLAVERRFPEIIFLPGFWVEIGMAAEPSGFGCKTCLFADTTPAVHPVINSAAELDRLIAPDPRTDGFMPVVLNYYRRLEPRVNEAGHVIKMVAARGPLTVATHVMGVSNFLLELKLNPQGTHRFLRQTTTLVRTWLAAQAEALREVEGILVLDDIAGFMSAKDYLEFGHPYLKEIFDAFPGAVKMFHNDTDNPVSYGHFAELGIHLFNFTHLQPLARVRERVGPKVCLVGNVPPLEVLARGTPTAVQAAARDCLEALPERRGLILSAGGGTSPGTPAENLQALVASVQPQASSTS
jgi:uroporphyrinogen decarboxylase